jgi:hypothetical protein
MRSRNSRRVAASSLLSSPRAVRMEWALTWRGIPRRSASPMMSVIVAAAMTGSWRITQSRVRATWWTIPKNGESGTHLYRAWSSMKQRCYNTKIRSAQRYSGRGIQVCAEWIDSFESFRDWARSRGYVEGKELDRIDNSQGYSGNCRWVTKLENLDNRAKYLPPAWKNGSKCACSSKAARRMK